MRHRHIVAVDPVGVRGGRERLARGVEMRDELMSEEIEVHPLDRRAPLRTAETHAVERARGAEVVDRDGEMERREHGDLDDAAAAAVSD